MNLFIVSGLSGSGKSIALQILEDTGMHCIDNLPAALLPHFVDQLASVKKNDATIMAAVGIDARNLSLLDAVPESLTSLQSKGVDYKIIFLDADESVLLKRFKETRRKHPMTNDKTSLMEAIRLERKLLEPLSRGADLRIDTTHSTPHDLRQRISDFVEPKQNRSITLLVESFGFKHGTPLDADFVFDVRCLPNPYWQHNLRRYTGLDQPVIDFMNKYEDVNAMLIDICNFIEKWLPRFVQEQRSYLTVAIGCTGGQHRSVFLSKALADHFTGMDNINVQLRHREIP